MITRDKAVEGGTIRSEALLKVALKRDYRKDFEQIPVNAEASTRRVALGKHPFDDFKTFFFVKSCNPNILLIEVTVSNRVGKFSQTMLRYSRVWRSVTQNWGLSVRNRSISALVQAAGKGNVVHGANVREGPVLQPWSGADVEAVVHQSMEEMIPCDIISLPGYIFRAPVRSDLVHRVVVWQLAKRRAGTAKTKSRSEVSGSGRKIRPQKGTGQSRQGARTSPIFRGGGRAHGPVPRDYSYSLPVNVRRNALRSVLTSKLECGQLWIVKSAAITDSRTRSVVEAMERNRWKNALVVDHDPEGSAGVDSSLHVASHNVRATLAMNALGLNVYDALSFDMLVLSTAAVDHLANRYSNYEWLF